MWIISMWIIKVCPRYRTGRPPRRARCRPPPGRKAPEHAGEFRDTQQAVGTRFHFHSDCPASPRASDGMRCEPRSPRAGGQTPAPLTSTATTLPGLANVATGPSCGPKSPAPSLPAAAKEACAALKSAESQLGSAQVSGTFPTTDPSSGTLARSHLGVNLHTHPYTRSKVRGPAALGRLHRAKRPTQSSPGGLEHTTAAVCMGRNAMAFSFFF